MEYSLMNYPVYIQVSVFVLVLSFPLYTSITPYDRPLKRRVLL